MNQSAKGKNQMKSMMGSNHGISNGAGNNQKSKQQPNINLPRLDRIVIKGSNPRNSNHTVERNSILQQKISKLDIHDMLKIQGKSSNVNLNINGNNIANGGRYNYQDEINKINAEKDIKAELRKIYNIKPSPIKKMRKKVELPKLI